MELFANIPGDDSVIDRILTLDKLLYGYPDFPQFHLAQFVMSNVECVPELEQISNQIYLLIWLACKVDTNGDAQSTFQLTERYAHLIHSDVMHIKLAQFLDEVAQTISEVIPAAQREQELNIFAHYLTNNDSDERPFAQILADFRRHNRCCSWLQERYVAAIVYVSSIGTLREYFRTSDSLFRKLVRCLQDDELGEEDWLVMVENVKTMIPDDTDIGKWAPLAMYTKYVFLPKAVDDRVAFVQLCTLFRVDWMKIWTLMGWAKTRRTTRLLREFKRSNKIYARHDTSTQLLRCV